jgi:hypothetical protein
MYLCARGIDFSPFYDFDFRTVPTLWQLFVFHLTVELCCNLGCCVLSFIGFHVQHGELAIRSIHLYMNTVFDQFPIRLSSNFNV